MSQVHVFVSYSHDDARWFADDKLMPRLIKSLEVVGAEVWYDHRRLGGGDPWKQEIVDAIKKAHIAVLLVSRNFLNSDFIREVELPRIERRFDQGDLIVVPILVGHCNWQNVRLFSRPQMIPGKPTPLISYLDSPAEWDRVQEEIYTAIERQVERVRDKYHMQAPVRQEPVIDPSTTITRLSGENLPYVPVIMQQHEAGAEQQAAPSQERARRSEEPRRDAAYDTHGRSSRATEPKKPSSTKSFLMPLAAAGLAALITAAILLRGTLSGGTATGATEAVPVRGDVPPASGVPAAPVPQGVIAPPPPQVTPAPAVPPGPNGNVTAGPNAPMPASSPGTSAQPAPTANPSSVPAVVNPAPPPPVASMPAPASAEPKPAPAPAPAPKPAPVKKVEVAPHPAQEEKAPPPQHPPKKPSDIVQDTAVDFLKGQLDKLKRP